MNKKRKYKPFEKVSIFACFLLIITIFLLTPFGKKLGDIIIHKIHRTEYVRAHGQILNGTIKFKDTTVVLNE